MPKKREEHCSFFLQHPRSTEPTLICFYMTLPDGKVRRSIGRQVLPGQWDKEGQRPISGKDKELKDIYQLIERIVEAIPGIKSECRRQNRVISRTDVNNALDVILQAKHSNKTEPAVGMFAGFEQIIAGMKDGSILTPGKNKKRYTAATIKNYEKRMLPVVKEFYKGKDVDWNSVTIDVYEDFVSWCHSKDLSNNSIGVYVKCWKRAGRIAFKKGWHTNPVFEDEDFLILKEETDDIYLDDQKIEKILNQKVEIKHYDIARDWFVLDCYLGLRVSDLTRLEAKDFQGKHFQFVNQKTGAKVAIPIHPNVKKIIRKWKGLPPPITDVKLNLYIKEVARLAKLKDKFLYKITKGGKVHQETLEEWQMISSHTCRRSFITRLLKIGVAHALVMKLAGIRRYDTLMRYFKMTSEEAADQMAGHEFFQ